MKTKALEPVDLVPLAFGQAIERARPALQRHARRLTRDHAAAEDLVQDTLTRAWRARRRFETGTNIDAWLFRIARNAFLSGLRRTRRQVVWNPDRHHLLLVQPAMQEEGLYSRDLRAALSRLPMAQQVIFMLIAQDGMSTVEAAIELGVPLGTVRSRISRARASIVAYFAVTPPAAVEAAAFFDTRSLVDMRAVPPVSDRPIPAERSKPTVYERWKASGTTTIG